MYLKVYNNNFVSCVESRLRYGIIRKKKMLICLLLFSRRKRSPAASIFLLFSIIPGYIIYIYRVSFLSKKIRRAIFVAGYVYLCVCVFVCVCAGKRTFPFLLSSKMTVKSGALCRDQKVEA